MANPDSTTVAGPVRELSAISFTGRYLVEVKYSVRYWISPASTTPMRTAQNAFTSFR